MSEKLFYICNLIVPKEEDFNTISEYLSKYPIRILREFPEEMYFEIPTMVYGWYTVKEKFPNHNILDVKVTKNLSWNFSKSEDEKEFFKRTESFFAESVKKWLPSEFILFDSYLNEETVYEFLEKNISKDSRSFIYFYSGALYIYNAKKNYIINIKSLSTSEKSFKKIITEIINALNPIVFSIKNIYDYVNTEDLKIVYAIDSLRWVKYGVETDEEYFQIIPNFNVHKFIPTLMSRLNSIPLDFEEELFYQRMFERDKITCWLSNREIAFNEKFETTKIEFKERKRYKLAKVNFSNKRTITGRIQARDDYNPQNLPKDTKDRENIISRFIGGKIVVFDYVSFEARIALQLVEDEEYKNKYLDKDLHYETAKVLFESNVTPEQRSFSKNVNNSLLYGASEETLIQKLSEFFKNPEEKLYQVKVLLAPIISTANKIKSINNSNGYLKSPWGYILKADKKHASFNNYMQMYASEIIIDKTIEIKELLKSFKSQYLFQVHDSIVFDISPDELFLIDELRGKLSAHEEMTFTIDCSIGPNYKEQKKLLTL